MTTPATEIDVSRGSDVLAAGYDYAAVTEKISSVVLLRKSGRAWRFGFTVSVLLVMILTCAVSYLFLRGVGIWGIDIPVAWGFAIVNFVWWIGIGHAGTFISAMLFLMFQDWRTSINRFAEAMTLFAVACAGMFPLLHLGRPWEFFWLLPYPNTMWLWPQFRSPLVWDVFAVSTYGIISLVFWFVGLIPDLATLRDRAQSYPARVAYGILALGWRGSARHWNRYRTAYLLLAGLAAPLVVSVHSVVGMDFAAAQLPGWHSTIFPPYFVAGAIFSGFAMVLTLAIPLRWAYGLQDFITIRHLENCAKLMLVTGLIVAYGYGAEAFYGWLSGNEFDMYMNVNRALGRYRIEYWMLIFCNVLTPQLLWFRAVRRNVGLLLLISLVIQVGMWTERFVIIITSLQRDFLPSSWGMYYPTRWDWATLFGSVGLFVFCFLLFVRFLPAISMAEMRELVHEQSRGPGKEAA
ncbi:MAG TPA: NrfD/PsrC family molybdoenzyme membrane anchor subunit [Tepidisphaeraceae bacterium]|jgi:molybdopterin-containing oxidoreductase family membrane subunit|nr:NrfD/PsrC family molybdoenzyme membrane anchor subunit [Tepidisphaeraceae bacterium]